MQNHSNNSTFEYVKYQVPLSGRGSESGIISKIKRSFIKIQNYYNSAGLVVLF